MSLPSCGKLSAQLPQGGATPRDPGPAFQTRGGGGASEARSEGSEKGSEKGEGQKDGSGAGRA